MSRHPRRSVHLQEEVGPVRTQHHVGASPAAAAQHPEGLERVGADRPLDGRVDARYCAICHTSQRAYGRAVSTATNGVYTGNTYVTSDTGANGEVLGEFGFSGAEIDALYEVNAVA